jgi:hypothetical protein
MSGGLVYLAVMSVFFCGCLIAMWTLEPTALPTLHAS